MTTHSRKFVLLAIALILLASLSSAFLHHHDDGQSFRDCTACKFVRQIAAFFVFPLFSLLALRPQEFFSPALLPFYSLLLPSHLRARAPPVLS